MNTLTDLLAELRRLFRYDPATGVLTRLVQQGGQLPGTVAGSLTTKGYRYVHVLGHGYMVHRLAWLMTHERWPTEQIDHINCIKTDNRIANLREASNAENSLNRRFAPRNNRTGVLGVRATQWGTFDARIRVAGKPIHIGTFQNLADAAAAYRQAKAEHHGVRHE